MTCQVNMASTREPGDSQNQQCTSCEGASARFWCLDCNEDLCDDCLLAHRRVSLTRSHRIHNQQPEEHNTISPTKFCRLHPSELLKIFCFTCRQLTCRDCQLVAHMNHRFQFVSEAAETLKKLLDVCIEPLMLQISESCLSLQKMEKRLNLLNACEKIMAHRIKENVKNLIRFLTSRVEQMINDLRKVMDLERERINTRMMQVKELHQNCMLVTKAAEDARNMSDLVTLFTHVAQITPQAKGLADQDSSPPPTMCYVKVTTTEECLSVFKTFGKLEISWVPFHVPSKLQDLLQATPTTSSPIVDTSSTISSPVANAPPTTSSPIVDTSSTISSPVANAPPTTSSTTSSPIVDTSSPFANAPPTAPSPVANDPPTTSSPIVNAPPVANAPPTTDLSPGHLQTTNHSVPVHNTAATSTPSISVTPSNLYNSSSPQMGAFDYPNLQTGTSNDAASTSVSSNHLSFQGFPPVSSPSDSPCPSSITIGNPISSPLTSTGTNSVVNSALVVSQNPSSQGLSQTPTFPLLHSGHLSHTGTTGDALGTATGTITPCPVIFHKPMWQCLSDQINLPTPPATHPHPVLTSSSSLVACPAPSHAAPTKQRTISSFINVIKRAQVGESSLFFKWKLKKWRNVNDYAAPKRKRKSSKKSDHSSIPPSSAPSIASSSTTSTLTPTCTSICSQSTTLSKFSFVALNPPLSSTPSVSPSSTTSTATPTLTSISPQSTFLTNAALYHPPSSTTAIISSGNTASASFTTRPVATYWLLPQTPSTTVNTMTVQSLSAVLPQLAGSSPPGTANTPAQGPLILDKLPIISQEQLAMLMSRNQSVYTVSGSGFSAAPQYATMLSGSVSKKAAQFPGFGNSSNIRPISPRSEMECSSSLTDNTPSSGQSLSSDRGSCSRSLKDQQKNSKMEVGIDSNEQMNQPKGHGDDEAITSVSKQIQHTAKKISPETTEKKLLLKLPLSKNNSPFNFEDPGPKGKPLSPETPENASPIIKSNESELAGKPLLPENELPIVESEEPEPAGQLFSPENELPIIESKPTRKLFLPEPPKNASPLIKSNESEPLGQPFLPESKLFIVKSEGFKLTREPCSTETSEDKLPIIKSKLEGSPCPPETSEIKQTIKSESKGEPFSPQDKLFLAESEGSQPSGEPLSPQDKLLIAESQGSEPSGEPLSPQDKLFIAESEGSEPSGEPFSPQDKLFLAESEGSQPSGEPLSPQDKLLIAESQGSEPSGEPLSPQDKLFIAESEGSEPSGEPFSPQDKLFLAESEGSQPSGEPLSPQDKLLIAESQGSEPSGEPLSPQDKLFIAESEGSEPSGEPFSPEGKLFIAESEGSEPSGEPFSPEGKLFIAESEGSEPTGEPFSPEGKLFIAESEGSEPRGEPFSPQDKLFLAESEGSEPTGEPFSPETSDDELMIIKCEPIKKPCEYIVLSDTEVSDSESEERLSCGNAKQDVNLFRWQPRVCLTRLPLSLPGGRRPLPRFRLIPGENEDEIYLEEIKEDSKLDAVSDGNTDGGNNSESAVDDDLDVTKDFTSPLSSSESPMSLEILSCSACGSSGASKICSACGRGYHGDCHVPPVGANIWSEWICSLCQDLLDPSDPYSADRPEAPQRGCLSLQDQRKCETLLLHLKTEGCSRVSESEFWSDLMLLSERLSKYSPPYESAGQLVSDIWTLFEDASRDDVFKDLQKIFQKKLVEILGFQLHPSLLIAPNADTPSAPGSPASLSGSGKSDSEGEASKVESTESKLRNMKKRLRDFLEMKTQHLAKRAKRE